VEARAKARERARASDIMNESRVHHQPVHVVVLPDRPLCYRPSVTRSLSLILCLLHPLTERMSRHGTNYDAPVVLSCTSGGEGRRELAVGEGDAAALDAVAPDPVLPLKPRAPCAELGAYGHCFLIQSLSLFLSLSFSLSFSLFLSFSLSLSLFLCIYIHTYTIHTYIHTYIHTFIHPYIHSSIHTYIHTPYIYTCIYIHTHIHTSIHPSIHPYIHTYIYRPAVTS